MRYKKQQVGTAVKGFFIWASVIFLIALAARLIPGPRTIDDAFITFRYARNILAGNGFVYNPGEHVLGTTTPLYTILLTVLAAFTGGTQAPFPLIALLVNALADAATCLLLFDLGRRLGSPCAGLGAALVWSIAPFSVTFAVGGLETSVYVLLLTATASAHLRKRHTLTALLCALSFLTRPDALILIGPLAVDRLYQLLKEIRVGSEAPGRRSENDKKMVHPRLSLIPFREILVFLLPVSAWIVFASFYFGSPIPHSIAAKGLAYHLPSTSALIRLLQHYATPFLDDATFGVPAIAVGLVLYPFLFIIGARRTLTFEPHAWPFLAFPWLYFAAFALANPLIFRWYLTPPLPVYILIILIGMDTLLTSIHQSIIAARTRKKAAGSNPDLATGTSTPAALAEERKPVGAGLAASIVIILLPFVLNLREWTFQPDHGLDRPAPDMAWYQLELLYRQATAILDPQLSPGPETRLLAAGDVGVLGFFTGAQILDTVGLTSLQSSPYYPLDPALYTINYAVPPDLILDYQPDFVVILEVYGRNGLLKDPRFLQDYTLLEKIPTDIYGSDGLLIFNRTAN